MHTLQPATVNATADGDLVMRGVNGDSASTTADGSPMTIDLAWRHGALERATIRSLLGHRLRVRRSNTARTLDTRRGATLTLAGDDLRRDRRPSPRTRE